MGTMNLMNLSDPQSGGRDLKREKRVHDLILGPEGIGYIGSDIIATSLDESMVGLFSSGATATREFTD